MRFDENLDIDTVANQLISRGEVFEGYALVLLQQIRDSIRKKEVKKK